MTALNACLVTWSRARGTSDQVRLRRGEKFDQSDHLQELEAIAHTSAPAARWSGSAAGAYGSKNTAHARAIGQLAVLDKRLGSHVTESAHVVSTGRQNLDSVRSWVLTAAQSVPVGLKRDHLLLPIVQRGLAQVGEVVATSNGELNAVGAKIRQLANEYAGVGDGEREGEKAPGEEDRTIQTVDFKQTPSGQAEDLTNRRQNQIDAFNEVFGRDPSSATDWQTAAALDPHSYDPDTDGVPPEIRVVRIRPVPGQGVVRVGQWIEQRDVISGPWKRDFGNTRPADPNFDPADTKVTTYIDYENGLVVMRQNSSVELTPDGGPGRSKWGYPKPWCSRPTTERSASNTMPRTRSLLTLRRTHRGRWRTIRGPSTVISSFTPTPDGVRVDGTRTDYPSMEVYQDFPGGSSRTVVIDPAVAGNSTGPMVNLPQHHDVGVGSAFAPFDSGGWNPNYDVPIPLPWREFGSTDGPPQVPSIRLPPGVTPL